MTDPRPYEILRRGPGFRANPADRFWSLAEMVSEIRRRNATDPQTPWTFRKRCPRDAAKILNGMLAERGITGWRVWFLKRRFLVGWMVNDTDGEDGMQLLGGSYAQAVEMIRSGTLDYVAGKITARQLLALNKEKRQT